jgi:hypothetical protein
MNSTFAAVTAALFFAASATADPLYGGTVRLTHEVEGTPLAPLDAVVGPGAEGFVYSDILVDVGADGLRVDLLAGWTWRRRAPLAS